MVDRRSGRPTQRAGGFVYRPPPIEAVRARAERSGGNYDSIHRSGIDTYTPKAGLNVIRFCPATWDNPQHYGFSVFQHSYVGADNGSYLCLAKMRNEACPICESARVARNERDEETAKKHSATERILAWVLDRNDHTSQMPRLFSMSWTMDRDIVALTYDPQTAQHLEVDNPDQGYDLTFQRQGQQLNTRYFGFNFSRQATLLHHDQRIAEEVLDYITANPLSHVLEFKSADYLNKMLYGSAAYSTGASMPPSYDGASYEPARGPARAAPAPQARPTRATVQRSPAPSQAAPAPWQDDAPDDEDAAAVYGEEVEGEEDWPPPEEPVRPTPRASLQPRAAAPPNGPGRLPIPPRPPRR